MESIPVVPEGSPDCLTLLRCNRADRLEPPRVSTQPSGNIDHDRLAAHTRGIHSGWGLVIDSDCHFLHAPDLPEERIRKNQSPRRGMSLEVGAVGIVRVKLKLPTFAGQRLDLRM